MRIDEALLEMKEHNNATFGGIAAFGDFTSRQSVHNIMQRTDCKISTLLKIADVLGYQIILANIEDGSEILIDE